MRSNICNRWFFIALVLTSCTFLFLLSYRVVDVNEEKRYVLLDDADVQALVIQEKGQEAVQKTRQDYSSEEISLKRGEWRGFSKEQIERLSTLGRIMYLGESPPKVNPEDKYTILVWKHGPVLENRHIKHWTKKRSDPFEKCSVKNCKLTYEDKDLDEADAVLFHLQRTSGPNTLPQGPRNQKQRWVFLTDESPYNTFLGGKSKLPDYNGLFNWSMTFRMDADVPVPYGRTVTAEEEVKVNLVYGDWRKGKRNDVLITTMSSNCGGRNHRMQYVRELQNFIPVDFYGGCGTLKCPGHFQTDCTLIGDYKFYLAFENSNCPHYITEKLWWNAYAKNAIPIVMGASKQDYKQLLPPNSYINVEEFANPADLARYIVYLNNTPYQFERYFKWRDNFRVLNEHGYFKTDTFHYCRLCEALNYNDRATKVYNNLSEFWNTNQCRRNWDDDRLQLNDASN